MEDGVFVSLITVYPGGDEDVKDLSRFVWAVYTNSPKANMKYSPELPYQAHDLAMGGETIKCTTI